MKGKGTKVGVEDKPSGSLSGSEAVTTATDKGYDESWIPADHINRPGAKRVKSSASAKSKSKAGE